MCGITGIFHRNGSPADWKVVRRMTSRLTHRGPDEEGYFLNASEPPADFHGEVPLRVPVRDGGGRPTGIQPAGNVALGHRRLSIVDLSSGQQPLCNEDGTIWISFNGEIYNFQSLQKELEAKGHRFRTRSDTETIVHAYEEWGPAAAERLRGMFAIAVWDESKQRLWLARDRVGKKPLYYLLDDDRLIFASEIKAILEAPAVPREIDWTALSDYLSLLYVPGPKSIFASIRKLPAAHYAVIGRDSCEVRRYWDLDFRPDHDRSEDQLADELLAVLDEATSLRMISEVPLGAFLSGGVDSSAVVALMAGRSPDPVVTNSISFSVAEYDESRYARMVAERFSTDHHEMRVTPDAIPVIEQLAWHYDEPFADSSAVPTYYVSKIARQNVTVSLSGDGGDENFAGYRRYYFDARENLVRHWVPSFARGAVFGGLGRLYPKADYLPRIFRGKAFISNVARSPVDAYFFSVSGFQQECKERILKGDLRRQLGDYQTAELFHDIYNRAPAEDHLSRIQYLDIKTYLCDDILTKVDRASMAVSLEVRCPVLDHVFMEHAARIPSRYKLVGRNGKHIFKKALRRHLPDEILYRSKMGFAVPILEWLRTDIKDYAKGLVMDGEASRNFLSSAELSRIWSEHQRGSRNWATELWAVMMLNLWYERFGKAAAGAGSD